MVASSKISEHELVCYNCSHHLICNICGEALCSRADDNNCAKQGRYSRANKKVCVLCADKDYQRYKFWTFFDSGTIPRVKLQQSGI